MYNLNILNEINEETIRHLFPHTDDLYDVLEAVEEDMLEQLPHWMIVLLNNEGFID
jgi:hypothetical protein